MDEFTIKWLFVLSTVVGFASAIVLSIDTIGLKLASRYIRKLRRGRAAAGTPDPEGVNLPPVAMFTGMVLVSVVAGWALFWAGPSAIWSQMSWKVAFAASFGLALLAWVFALIIMLVAELAIAGLRVIKWLHVRQYAGIIGFGLLAVSFALQLIASLADALGAAPR